MILPNETFWSAFKSVQGALSCCEALAIMNIASEAPQGIYLELGTHKGKSAISAMQYLSNGEFHLVDPIFNDLELAEQVVKMVLCHSNKIVVGIIPKYSIDIIENYNKLSYVFVDSGSHQDGLPMQEVKMLEDRIVSGGIIAFHDFDSQFKEVREAYNYLLNTGKYEEISIPWDEIRKYVLENNLEENNQSWHHTELETPCFVGALKRK